MSLERLANIRRNFVSGLVLGGVLATSFYMAPNICYSAEPSARESKKEDPMSLGFYLLYTTQKSLEAIGVQGGYGDTKPKVRQDIRDIFVPYYYDRGKILMPETKDIEKELSDYVDNHFLDVLKLQGKIRVIPDGSKIKTQAKIKEGEVEFSYNITLKFSRDDFIETIRISPGPIPVKSKLYEMLEIARFVTDSHKEDPNMISISTLLDMARKRDLRVQSLGFNDLPDCTFYKITKRKEGENYTQLGPLSDITKKGEKTEKTEKDESGEPEVFQFFNRYNPRINQGIPQAPAPQAPKTPDSSIPAPSLPSAPKADPST